MKKQIVWMSDVPFANSGMGIQARHVVSHLIKAGHEVTYFAWFVGNKGEKTTYKILQSYDMPVYFLGKGGFGDASLVTHLLEMVNPDVFISFGDMHMIQELTKLSHVWREKWLHWWPVDSDGFDSKSTKIAQQIPYHVATTEFGAKIINKITGQTPPIIEHVVQFEGENKGNKKVARQNFGLTDDDIVFGCVARNFWRKNLNTLLRSFAEACKSRQNLKLVLHTDVVSAKSNGGCDVAALVNDLKVNGKVFLSNNNVNTDDMAKLFDLMDYHVLTSYGEGFGVPIIESMARGVPNIVPNNTTMPELVADAGFVVPLSISGNIDPLTGREFFGPCPQKLADMFCHAADICHTDKYNKMAKQAKGMVKKFQASNVLPKWLKLVNEYVPQSLSQKNSGVAQFNAKKPRALLCSMFYVPNLLGGGEYTIYELMKGLVQHGWDCKVLTMYEGIKGKFRDPLPEKTYIQDGIEVTHCGNRWYDILENMLQNNPPDVLITYEIFSWYSLKFLRAAKKHGVKTVMYEQFWRLITTKFDEIISQPVAPPQEGLECNQKTDLLIANSDHMHDVFVKFLSRDCPVVYPPMDLQQFDGQPTDEFIVFVNPGKGKGSETVFYLADHLPNEHFMFVGAIAEDETFLNIKKRPNIEYHAHTDDMTELYRRAKIVLFPSTVAESFGRVPIEAMAHGVPVVARGVGAVPQNLEHSAVVIDRLAGDGVWLDAVKKLLKTPQERKRTGSNGREFVRNKFNKDAQNKKFSDLLLDLVKKRIEPDPEPQRKKVMSICDPGYLGVDTALRYAQSFFADQFEHVTLAPYISGEDVLIDVIQKLDDCQANVIIYGGWNQAYDKVREYMRKNRPHIKHVINWHSPLAQIEMANEIGHFIKCNNMICKGQVDFIVVPFKPDAEVFQMTYHKNYKWFPDTIGDIKCEKMEIADPNFKVGFFAMPSPRKNILAQFSAARILNLYLKANKLPWPGVTLYLGNGFDKYAHYMNFLKVLDIPYVILPHFCNKKEYYNYLGSMDANIQVTFSEAFNYVCAESLALGVPCLGSKMTPALRNPVQKISQFIDKFLVVDEIDNAMAIFTKLQNLITIPADLRKEMQTVWATHVNVIRQQHNKAIEIVLQELAQ